MKIGLAYALKGEIRSILNTTDAKLLETVAAAIYARRGEALPLERPGDEWAEKGYAVTEEQLKKRVES